MQHHEEQYLNLIREILENGNMEEGRNGITKSIFGHSMRFSLKDGCLPLLTTKKVAWKTCFKELIWFMKGCTDNNELIKQNVHIWDDNSTREFLDSRGLQNNAEGDLGPVYGHQWRHFNAEYTDCHTDYTGKGIDQLQNIIKQLRTEDGRKSRRLIMSAWNPCQIDEMALPPCHVLIQFNVRQNKYLSCSLYQRSCDVGLGVAFNIASYSFLTHIMAKHCGLIAEDFVYFMGNAHIYEEHIDAMKLQITHIPKPFPTIVFKDDVAHENIEDYSLTDFTVENYISYEKIKMKMIA
jgi:thymidylate synthase